MALKCTYDPRVMAGLPLGMFHCPDCGSMVLAGMAHPDYSEGADEDNLSQRTESKK